LTSNKLDVSIFQFKDRPIFKKREPSPPPAANLTIRSSVDNGGFEELKGTRPTKKPLAQVQKTDFSVDEQAYRDHQDSKSMLSAKGSISPDKPVNTIYQTEAPLYSTLQGGRPSQVNLSASLTRNRVDH
jgi:hypothetical protein